MTIPTIDKSNLGMRNPRFLSFAIWHPSQVTMVQLRPIDLPEGYTFDGTVERDDQQLLIREVLDDSGTLWGLAVEQGVKNQFVIDSVRAHYRFSKTADIGFGQRQ